MNYINRLFKSSLLLKILKDAKVGNDSTTVAPILLTDGFYVENYIHKMNEEIKSTVLSLFNEAVKENYNHIEKIGNKLTITKINHYESKTVGLYSTDFISKPTIQPIYDLKNVNGIFLMGTSGTGKTTFARHLIENSNNDQVVIFTPKEEDYQDKNWPLMGFEDEHILKLTEIIEKFNKDKEFRKELELFVIIDEFLLLTQIKEAQKLIEAINKCLAFNRSSKLKFLFISQTLNKSQLGKFNIGLTNTKLINAPDLKNYEDTLGNIEPRFLEQLPIGKFLELSHDKRPRVLFYEEK